MRLAIGCDHAAAGYKSVIRKLLSDEGHEVLDVGIEEGERADYPDVAEKACRLVASGEAERGILICGTGIGMAISANKIKGIRAAAVSEGYSARLSREHNDANVLCFGSRVVGIEVAAELVRVFLETPFEGGRHAKRVEKITKLDEAVPEE